MGQWGCMRREKQRYNNDIQRFTLFRYLFITLADAPILYTRNRDSKPSRKFTQFRNVIGFLPNYKQSCNASARGIAGTERSPVSKVSQNYRSTQPFSALEAYAEMGFTIPISFRFRLVDTRAKTILSFESRFIERKSY